MNKDTTTRFAQFTHQYSLSKTLRFELKPVGATKKLVRKIKDKQDFNSPLSPLILEDKKRELAYKQTKQLIDNLHRDFLAFALHSDNITDTQKQNLLHGDEDKADSLSDFYDLYQQDKKAKKANNTQKMMAVQKELAGKLSKILDSAAPKFLSTLSQQRDKIITLKSADDEALKELQAKRKTLAQRIKQTDKKETEKIAQLRDERADIDRRIDRKTRAIKEYDKALKFKFDKANQLHNATQSTFTLLRLYGVLEQEHITAISQFDNFYTYFTGFNDNRANVYDTKGTGEKENWHFLSTSIAHRLFEQNLKFHCDNILKWQNLQKVIPQYQTQLQEKGWDFASQLAEIENSLGFSNQQLFSIASFPQFLSQSGIDKYNQFLGGHPAQENQAKQQGINELINLTRQQAYGRRSEFLPMQTLYKQILSDREDNFIDAYEKPKDMFAEINHQLIEQQNFLQELQQSSNNHISLTELLNTPYEEPIYLSKDSLRSFSKDLTGQWDAIENWYLQGFQEKEQRKLVKTKTISIEDLEDAFKGQREWSSEEAESKEKANFYHQYILTADKKFRPWVEHIEQDNILLSFCQAKLKDLLATLQEKTTLYQQQRGKLQHKATKKALENQEKKPIKNYLDAYLDLYRFLRQLTVRPKELKNDKIEQNILWEQTLKHFIENNTITRTYNKTRNFLTKKPFSTHKFKLNFQNSTLADGWDVNKERDNTAVLLRKDGQYYLAIMNKEHNTLFADSDDDKYQQALQNKEEEIHKQAQQLAKKKESTQIYQNMLDKLEQLQSELHHLELLKTAGKQYEKINYKLLSGANKMLPKVFFAKKNIAYFAPSTELKENYDKGLHKKGENFNIHFCHQLIDFFKSSINKHWEWGKAFDWEFSDTRTYQDISGFYQEVDAQGYKLSFSSISQAYIDKMVDEGKLHLFHIYNKDFSTERKKDRKRTDNLHTLYWKALFEEKNLHHVIIKLNGEAELFYRQASLNYSKKKREKGHHYDDEKKLKDKFPHPILKDKRYAEDKISFHCPITLNFQATGNSNINQDVNEFLKNNHDVNIIGIDRGERNLLYFMVINPQGNILEQGSWNTIDNGFREPIDYHAKLDAKEKERKGARENWESIENIKELKVGYLSQVVYQLSQLILKYNAIVVLEDLSPGFKRGRFKVEKQVYQKFERALIEKLNYLVDKQIADNHQPGHYLHGLQLTNEFKSFQKLGTQSGILFYTTASYTSKTDPITGYMRTLYPKYQDAKQAQQFFAQFDRITFNGNSFEFTYNLKNFKGITGGLEDKEEFDASQLDQAWTIDSRVTRSSYHNQTKSHKLIDITATLTKLFKSEGIELTAHSDLKTLICDHAKCDHYQQSGFLAKLMAHFNRLLDMRVTDSAQAEKREEKDENGKVIRTQYIHNAQSDFIVSPVAPFYDSRQLKDISHREALLPQDSDANGAYNIARKGIMILHNIHHAEADKNGKLAIKLAISKTDWQHFVQDEQRVKKQIEKWYSIIERWTPIRPYGYAKNDEDDLKIIL